MKRLLVPGVGSASILGGLALTSGVALTATSGWLIVAASYRPPILTLLAIIVLVRAFGIARPLLRYLERVHSHDAALAYLAEERTRVYRQLIPLTPARLGRRGRGDVLAGVVDDLDDIAMAQIRGAVPLVALLITGAAAALIDAMVLIPAAWVVLGTVAAALLVGWLDLTLETRSQAAVVEARADVGRLATVITQQASELRAIGGEAPMAARLREAEARLTRAVSRQARGRALGVGLASVVTVAGAIVMAYVVAPWIEVGLPAALGALLVLTPVALGEVVGGVPDAVGALARERAARQRVNALVGQIPAVAAEVSSDATDTPGTVAAVDTAADRTAGEPAAGPALVTGEVRPHEVDASAPRLHLATREVEASWDGARTALGATSIEVPPGTMLAVTGPNGAGKSTLLAVLARHLDPSAGTYRQGERDALAMPLAEARAGLAVVDDETHVLASTVRENLRFARPDADDEAVLSALRQAGLSAWFEGLPGGLDTRVGAGGQGVSGGERTRLGIARALLSGRPVVLLDEPTAHLDHPTAVAVLADLRSARDDRTIVLVTHRAEGIDEADTHLHIE